MDLKCGNGAFMDNLEDARKLAKSIVNVANAAGCKTSALLTDMNQVLGTTVGNALEMQEAVEYLQGRNKDKRLHQITLSLCAELLLTSKLADSIQEAEEKLNKALKSGKALEIFSKMVAMLGGPKDFAEHSANYLPKAKVVKEIFAKKSGYISGMNTRNIGLALIKLKGGRVRSDQKLDYATGFSDFCQIGDYADAHTPLCVIHAQSEEEWQEAAKDILDNIQISDKEPAASACVIEKIG